MGFKMNAQELFESLSKLKDENVDLSKIEIVVEFEELVAGTGTIYHLAETENKMVWPSSVEVDNSSLTLVCL